MLMLLTVNSYALETRADTATNEVKVTGIQRAITEGKAAWLNVSRPLSEKDLQGRIVLLDFWTYCCINCMHIIPDFHSLEKQFGDKLTVIGVHSAKFTNEKDEENIRSAIIRYDIKHPVINDRDFRVWENFRVRSWPTLVLINPQGKIEKIYSGEGHLQELQVDIAMLTEQYKGQINESPLPIALEANKAPETLLKFPAKFAYAPTYNHLLFVSDSNHHRILGLTLSGDIVLNIGSGEAGLKDGDFATASFNKPQGVFYHEQKLYVADTENHAIRSIDLKTRMVETLAGTGQQGHERFVINGNALTTRLASPWDITLYPTDSMLTIAMAGTHQLWTYSIKDNLVSLHAGNGRESIEDGRFPDNSLSQPSGLSVYGDTLYFVDSETSALRQMNKDSITTLIGTGLFDFGYVEGKQGQAKLQHPLGLFADESGVYIADSYNHSIRFYDLASGKLTNFAGHGKRGSRDGTLKDAEFNEPNGIIKIGNLLYVADTNNHAIRIIDPEHNTVSTMVLGEAPTLSESLPNLEKLPQQTLIAGRDIPLTLSLMPHWKINNDAPSWLYVFKKDHDTYTIIKRYTMKEIQEKTVLLPKLEADVSYRIQASFYYCQDKEGSICLLKSIDIPVKTVTKGKDKVIINLKTTEKLLPTT